MLSFFSAQAEDSKQTPLLFSDQWLQSNSVRYLPDNINALVVAMAILEGDEPAVNQRGWGFERDMKFGLK